jgi:hypothetical protein
VVEREIPALYWFLKAIRSIRVGVTFFFSFFRHYLACIDSQEVIWVSGIVLIVRTVSLFVFFSICYTLTLLVCLFTVMALMSQLKQSDTSTQLASSFCATQHSE